MRPKGLAFESHFESYGKEGKMVLMQIHKDELEQLTRRRELLRRRLQKHFSTPPVARDYAEFEKIVDELEELRQRLFEIKNR